MILFLNAAFTIAFIPLSISAQFQCSQSEQDEHHSDDPETNNNAGLRPPFQFEMVMQRRHAEDALASQLERANLEDYGNRLHHEYAPHDEQHDLVARNDCHDSERRT
jgi:hypothetical protein